MGAEHVTSATTTKRIGHQRDLTPGTRSRPSRARSRSVVMTALATAPPSRIQMVAGTCPISSAASVRAP